MFSVAVCSSCGAGWTLPRVPPEALAAYYPHSYGYLVDRRVQRAVQKAFFAWTVRRPPWRTIADAPPGRLLDVGCGRGDLGAALTERGWRVAGIDPSAEAVAFARARGIDAHTGTLETVPFPDGSFDAVVMRHSLEHVADPRGDLVRVHALLAPGGLLAVSVPNFDSWERRSFGSAWFHLDLPRHRTHFGPRALRVALESTDFDVLELATAGDPGSLLASVQYKLAGRLFSRSVPALWIQYSLGIAASPVRALLDRLRGGGAVLNAVARRPA